jgi:hypothetical protein
MPTEKYCLPVCWVKQKDSTIERLHLNLKGDMMIACVWCSLDRIRWQAGVLGKTYDNFDNLEDAKAFCLNKLGGIRGEK